MPLLTSWCQCCGTSAAAVLRTDSNVLRITQPAVDYLVPNCVCPNRSAVVARIVELVDVYRLIGFEVIAKVSTRLGAV